MRTLVFAVFQLLTQGLECSQCFFVFFGFVLFCVFVFLMDLNCLCFFHYSTSPNLGQSPSQRLPLRTSWPAWNISQWFPSRIPYDPKCLEQTFRSVSLHCTVSVPYYFMWSLAFQESSVAYTESVSLPGPVSLPRKWKEKYTSHRLFAEIKRGNYRKS